MEFFTPLEVANLLKVKRLTVYIWIHKKYFPNATKFGKQWRIPKSDIEKISKGEPK